MVDSANDLDRILIRSRDIDRWRTAGEASKSIRQLLCRGPLRLRELWDKVAQTLGFDDFFTRHAAE